MIRPSALITPREGAATISGIGEKGRDGWALRRGLGDAAMLIAPGGSAARSGAVTPTLDGSAAVFTTGRGAAWRIAEGTTNYVPNPRFSPAWVNSHKPADGAATVTIEEGTAPEGIPATLKVAIQGGATTGTSGRFLFNARTLIGLSGGTFSESVWARTSNPDLIPMIYTDVRDGTGIVGTMVTPTNALPAGVGAGQWFRITLTSSAFSRPPTNANLYVGIYPRTPNASGTVEFAGPQFEPLAYASPYADGSLGSGYAWTGTPHQSASNRVTGRVLFPVFAEARGDCGAIALRYRPHDVAGKGANPHILFGSSFNFYRHNRLVRYTWNAPLGSNYEGTAHPEDGFFLLEWDGPNRWLTLGGERRQLSTTQDPAWRPPTQLAFGSTGIYSGDGDYEGAALFDRLLTDEEREYLRTMGRWEWGADGALTVPLGSTPAETYLRYREAGVERIAILTGSGPVGSTGSAAISGATLTVRADRGDLEVMEVLAFPERLSPWDQATVLNARTWTRDLFEARISLLADYEPRVVHQRPTTLVTISGVPTPVDSWTTRHGVNQPIGTASITVPLGGDVSHIDLNATVEIQAGYRDQSTRRVFLGRITDIERRYSIDGASLRLQCEDWMTLFRYPLEEDLIYAGRTRLDHLFRSLAELREMPQIEVAPTKTSDGYWISFGGVPAIDDGDLVLKRRSSPLTFLTSKARLFGYRVFGKPSGPAALARVSGIPAARPIHTFVQGVDLIEVGEDRSVKPMVTNWTVYGARYTDADGVTIELRSYPKRVPPEPYLDPPGWASDDISDSILTTQILVDAVRETQEIDHSAPEAVAPWTTWGWPEIEPGDVVAVHAPESGIPEPSVRWVTGVDHRWSRSGFTSSFTGWAGAGRPLEAGIDQEMITIGPGPYRLGDEWLNHYVIKAPTGDQVTVPFTVPKQYSSLALVGRQHGTNSYLQDGASTEITVSQLEVWQNGEKVGSAQLPVSDENLSRAYDYREDRYWEGFRMAIPGKLEPGPAELRIVAGKLPGGGGIDDFEVKNLAIEARGTGAAILPGRRA